VDNPTVEDHSIYCKEVDLRIPSESHQTFSYFHTSVPTDKELNNADVILMTPDGPSWNPYSDHYTANEEAISDWEGNMMEE
jgi:hypothetical protein